MHVNSLKAQNRDWSAFIEDLDKKLEAQRAEKQAVQTQLDDLSLLAQAGHAPEDDSFWTLKRQLDDIERSIDEIEGSKRAAASADQSARDKQANDDEVRRSAKIRKLTLELSKAAADLDRSFKTLGERYLKAAEAARELQQVVGRKSIQATEDVAKPLKNFERCMASHLPHNVGPAKIDSEPLAMTSLTPNPDILIELTKR